MSNQVARATGSRHQTTSRHRDDRPQQQAFEPIEVANPPAQQDQDTDFWPEASGSAHGPSNQGIPVHLPMLIKTGIGGTPNTLINDDTMQFHLVEPEETPFRKDDDAGGHFVHGVPGEGVSREARGNIQANFEVEDDPAVGVADSQVEGENEEPEDPWSKFRRMYGGD